MVRKDIEIIDIRDSTANFDLVSSIKSGLRPQAGGGKKLPTLLLYDEQGLRLFEKITYLDEYYLTNAEIEILERDADKIALSVPSDSVLVELGSGNLRKVNILLEAIERLGKPVEYYAVDLSLPELKRTFAEIPTEGYRHIECFGLWGTYDNALDWLKLSSVVGKPKIILWLGSSLGNFKRHEIGPFLAGFGDVLRPGDSMLIGIDSCKNPERVYHAYNDRENVTHEFILNGLTHANRLLGEPAFDLSSWEVIGEYDQCAGRHHAFVSPLKDVVIDGVAIKKGERILIEESYKFSTPEIMQLWDEAGVAAHSMWTNTNGDYGLHLVNKPYVFFRSKPEEYANNPVPSLSEWKELWATWDLITRKMIPEAELLSKPIKLRNALIFYLGHIPTFLDIHLARSTDGSATEPAYFWDIFERGIDPDVDDPTKCHAHSEVPDTWPSLEKILQHQLAVRSRVEHLYSTDQIESKHDLAHALWLGFEHEAMHLETLLYMLVQSEEIFPPPGTARPNFAALAKRATSLAVENKWITIPKTTINIGLTDDDDDLMSKRYFGWDNERPQRSTEVPSFCAKAQPITNRNYAAYLVSTDNTTLPASWCENSYSSAFHEGEKISGSQFEDHINGVNGASNDNGVIKMNGKHGLDGSTDEFIRGKYVRTVYGSVPLEQALDWPVAASYDELSGCARWMGGRIPTMEEVRSIHKRCESEQSLKYEELSGSKIPAVNGHLLNNGVDESPPHNRVLDGRSGALARLNPRDLFVDLTSQNVGFKHWHPVPVTDWEGLRGQADLGGVWEWTSTVLEKHDGFKPMKTYPGYTADFFDGKHNIMLGGSWATHPRLAGRKTFVNWYQRNYPYVWAGARLVKDV